MLSITPTLAGRNAMKHHMETEPPASTLARPSEPRPTEPKLTPNAMPRGRSEDRIAAAAYIAEMATVLAERARGHGFDALGHTLDISRLEAESVARIRPAGRVRT
jgi:hypothetical protein